ncbi:hypothetical protein PVAND_002684 [Polypedilum vanderplanki]|uniref:Uncharacterized protein n=1 Tax=Polypedilum vanderplanki TaxID=319348 RepID=A0A9J6BRX2_POLVA|nr:hypothetical protein PVAND_002684 [Polypedilum vanderplanki]
MENARNNNNWLALLRRKIQKKFKKTRQKTTIAENQEIANQDENEEIQAQAAVEQQQQQSETIKEKEINNEYQEMKKELFKLACYWPKLTRAGAQKILKNTQNGSFLIRDSGTADNSITLSFRSNNKTFHCRNQFNAILNSQQTAQYNIITAIEDSIKKSQSSVVGFVKCDNNELSVPIAVRLIYPINRNVPSLQNLCLSLVVSNINQSTAINSLPLPLKIKEIVRENYNTL